MDPPKPMGDGNMALSRVKKFLSETASRKKVTGGCTPEYLMAPSAPTPLSFELRYLADGELVADEYTALTL